jgi:opacity protein-like surface antigen
MRPIRLVTAGLALCLLAAPSTARADITAFLGVTPTPQSRVTRGAAIGMGLVAVGFEIEAASTVERQAEGVPGLRTGMANGFVQTPIAVSGVQFYGTAGGGVYRESLAGAAETNLAVNLGGGVKVKLAGPLRLRADYRLFRLRGAPRYETYHRFYAGLTLGF